MTDFCLVNEDTNRYYEEIDRLTLEFESQLRTDAAFKKAYEIYDKRVGGLCDITNYDLIKINEIKNQLEDAK